LRGERYGAEGVAARRLELVVAYCGRSALEPECHVALHQLHRVALERGIQHPRTQYTFLFVDEDRRLHRAL
jgi:hypothetical protein